MKAAILNPGPSLNAAIPRIFAGEYALIAGVNRAVARCRCDVWAVFDYHTALPESVNLDRLERMRPQTIVASVAVYNQIRDLWPPAAAMRHVDPVEIELAKAPIRWTKFTHTSAVAAAWWLCREQLRPGEELHIDSVGCDWSGDADFDGHTHAKNCRTPERWIEEQRVFEGLVELLADRGCTVRRVVCQESEAPA